MDWVLVIQEWAKLDSLYLGIYNTANVIDYNEVTIQTIVKLQLCQKMSRERYPVQFQENWKSNGWIDVVKEVRKSFSFSDDEIFEQSSEEWKQKNLPGKNESLCDNSVVGGCLVCRNNWGKTREAEVERARGGYNMMWDSRSWTVLSSTCHAKLFGLSLQSNRKY